MTEEDLVARYEPMFRRLVYRRKVPVREDWYDMMQVARLAAVQAARTIPSGSLERNIKIFVSRRISEYQRAMAPGKRSRFPVLLGPLGVHPVRDKMLRAAETSTDIARLLATVTPAERRVFDGYLGDFTSGEIGREIGRKPKYVDLVRWRAIQRIRAEFRIGVKSCDTSH